MKMIGVNMIGVNMEGYERGIELFNGRHFYDAHEVWEDVWRESNGPEKKFLQGLIQAAVALHHHSRGNSVGACSLLERARKNLIEYPKNFGGIRVADLVSSLAAWRESMLAGRPAPSFPEVRKIE